MLIILIYWWSQVLHRRKLKCTSKHISLDFLQPEENPVPLLPGSLPWLCPNQSYEVLWASQLHTELFSCPHFLKTFVRFSSSSPEKASWEQQPCSSLNLITTFSLIPYTILVHGRCSISTFEWIKIILLPCKNIITFSEVLYCSKHHWCFGTWYWYMVDAQ